VLAAARARGLTIIHTREGFAPDLSDLQPHRRWRPAEGGPAVGDEGPLGRFLVRGEPCWEIIPELAPRPGEAIFDKTSYGAFSSTALDAHLRERGVRHLILTGLTTDCCIQSNLREALDRGYDCLTLEDCCGASSQETHELSMRLIRKRSGVFGAVASSKEFLAAMGETAATRATA
jgi:nicotinamidase-related amidase